MKFMLLWALHSLGNTLRIARRIFVVAVVFCSIISLFLYFTHKDAIQSSDTNPIERGRERIYAQLADLEKDTSEEGKVSAFVYRTWVCSSVGEACTDNPADGDTNFHSSIIGSVSGLISTPYAHPPASGIAWVGHGLQQAGFVPSAYAAQGLGFASISMYMEIWKLFRDIAYVILVLIMVAIGFMIMFRMKLDAQTVIGIENALPRIVIALIMITFSFPIAGFMIDIMYMIITISVGLIFNAGLASTTTNTLQEYLNDYLNAGFTELWPDGGGTMFSVGNSLWTLFPTVLQTGFHAISIPFAGMMGWNLIRIPNMFTEALSGIGIGGFSWGNTPKTLAVALMLVVFSALLIWGPGIIFGVLILITVLYFMFRVFFMLLGSYIKILLYIIFSPIILMMSAIPGNGILSWWLKNLFGELITFPTVIILMMVGNAIFAVNGQHAASNALPFGYYGLGDAEAGLRLPFLYKFNSDDFNTILALGLIFMTPDFVRIIKEWIGAKGPPVKFGLGTFFAGVGAVGGGGMSSISRYGSLSMAFPGLTEYLMTTPLGQVGFVKSLFSRGAGLRPEGKQGPATADEVG